MSHGSGWQQNSRACLVITLPTRSPPVGLHLPGSFVIHVAAMLARPMLVTLLRQPASCETASDPIGAPHDVSEYVETRAEHPLPVGGSHVHGVHDRASSNSWNITCRSG